MNWVITKCYSRGNVGVTGLGSDYDFCEVGKEMGPDRSGYRRPRGSSGYILTEEPFENIERWRK